MVTEIYEEAYSTRIETCHGKTKLKEISKNRKGRIPFTGNFTITQLRGGKEYVSLLLYKTGNLVKCRNTITKPNSGWDSETLTPVVKDGVLYKLLSVVSYRTAQGTYGEDKLTYRFKY